MTGAVVLPFLAAGICAGFTLAAPTAASAATTQHDPIGALNDAPRSGPHGLAHSVMAVGFARDYDSSTPVLVTISVDHIPVIRVLANKLRAASGNYTAFSEKIAVGSGRHRVCAYAHNIGPGQSLRIGCFTVHAIWKLQNVAVADLAAHYVGYPYVTNGDSPSGFDCSGFTSYVFDKAIRKHLAHSAQTQSDDAFPLTSSSVRTGDLVFFHSGGSVYHVAIYAGSGTIWAAATPSDGVVHQDIWSSDITYGSFTHH